MARVSASPMASAVSLLLSSPYPLHRAAPSSHPSSTPRSPASPRPHPHRRCGCDRAAAGPELALAPPPRPATARQQWRRRLPTSTLSSTARTTAASSWPTAPHLNALLGPLAPATRLFLSSPLTLTRSDAGGGQRERRLAPVMGEEECGGARQRRSYMAGAQTRNCHCGSANLPSHSVADRRISLLCADLGERKGSNLDRLTGRVGLSPYIWFGSDLQRKLPNCLRMSLRSLLAN